jgi:hypothetical protein
LQRPCWTPSIKSRIMWLPARSGPTASHRDVRHYRQWRCVGLANSESEGGGVADSPIGERPIGSLKTKHRGFRPRPETPVNGAWRKARVLQRSLHRDHVRPVAIPASTVSFRSSNERARSGGSRWARRLHPTEPLSSAERCRAVGHSPPIRMQDLNRDTGVTRRRLVFL